MASAVGSTTTLPKTSNIPAPAIPQAQPSDLQKVFQKVSSEQHDTLMHCKQFPREKTRNDCNDLAVTAGVWATEDLLKMTAAGLPIQEIQSRVKLHTSALEGIRTCKPGELENILAVVTRVRGAINAASSSTKPAGRDNGGVFISRD